jgi:laminin alpha 3/5
MYKMSSKIESDRCALPESGECECKPAFMGAKDCSACADGFYDYPECKPCDCFANGTR